MANGLHYADALAGRVFCQSATPLGLAIPIYTATAIAGGMPIYNPPFSNRLVELISVDIAYGSGPSDYGAVGLMGLPLTGVAAGALCTAFAVPTPSNGYLLGGIPSKVQSSNAGTGTVTAGVATVPSATAPGWIRPLASINLEAVTGTAHGVVVARFAFDGTLIVPPGTMIYLAAGRATTALYCSAVVWKETTINPQAG